MKGICLALILCLGMATLAFGSSDFEDITVPAQGYYNGSDSAGQFTSGDATFSNLYEATYGSWEGFAYSELTDTTTPGFSNQYSAITGGGESGSGTYAVAFTAGFNGTPSEAIFDTPTTVGGLYVTNTTFAYLSMRDGDSFAKQFGGTSGDDPDFFRLIVQGYDNSGSLTGEVDVYLADYRFSDNTLDYIIDEWAWVNLRSLGTVARLVFELESSDNGTFGMNTPAYFALDSIEAPATIDGGGSGGCFITTAGDNPSGNGIALFAALLFAGLCVLGINKK